MMKFLCVIFAAISLAGCVTGGISFQPLMNDQISLNVDTTDNILQKLGRPFKTGSTIKNGKKLETLNYAFSETSGEGAQKGVTPARGQNFYFYEDILVGQEFLSSYAQDSTDFDDRKIENIVENRTSIDEVVKLLGQPTGEYIYPMVSSEDEKAIIYLYSQVSGSAFNMSHMGKHLTVSYNAKTGVITNVKFEKVDNQ